MMKLFPLFFLIFSSLAAHDNTKICLTMIVKNESKIIERLLDSVKDIVDCVSICDTGSDDNTPQIIERYLRTHKIPGKVYHHEWKNFGHNRTLSAKMAKETIKLYGYSPSKTYLLLLDADMILNISPDFKKSDLTAGGYLVNQKTNYLSYNNIRLVNASLDWKCVGVTHEYWDAHQEIQNERLESLVIDDREDGGSKMNKFERDIKLLTQGLKDEPENSRYLFYLAQSYRDIGNVPLAIEYYEKRANAGGWDEEVFEALLQIAILQQHQNLPLEKIAEGYKRAYLSRPNRAEPLYFLSMLYRDHKKYDLAYKYAKIGESIPFPHQDDLFIFSFIYDWAMKLELSACAYWANQFEECQKLSKELLQNPHLPQDVKKIVTQNLNAANVKLIEEIESPRFSS